MGILNAASNAIRGVTDAIGSLAQPNLGILGINIPGVPIVGFRDVFLKSMETWVGAIPLRTQWIVLFDGFPADLNSDIIRGLEPIGDGDKRGWDIDRAKFLLASYPAQRISGCIFAQGVNIPDDTFQANVANINNNKGYIPGLIGGNRSRFSPLTIEFRETNTSFTDCVIRPWTILAAHRGLVARPDPSNNIKTNITVIQYTRSYQNISQIPRKVWRFYDCVPTNVGIRNLTYDAESMEVLNTQWSYNHYSVVDNLYLPLPDLFDKIF